MYSVRRKDQPTDAGEAEWKTASDGSEEFAARPSSVFGENGGGDASQIERREGLRELGAGPPNPACNGGSGSEMSSTAPSAQVPPSPSLSVQVPSSPSLSVHVPPVGSPFDRNRTQLLESGGTQGGYNRPTFDEPYQLCPRRGYAGKDSEAVLTTRLSTMDAVGQKRVRGKEDAAETPEEMPATQEKHRCDTGKTSLL